MILPAYVQSSEVTVLPKNLILKGSEKLMENKGVTVARVPVDSQTHTIPVRVLNPHEKEVQLYKETILGIGHQVLEINEGRCYSIKSDISDHTIPSVTYIGHYISTLYITYIRHYISALFNLSFMFIHCHKR